MEQNTLHAFEARCTQEEPPACQTTCPLHVEARTFCALMGAKKFREARAVLDRTMPLSGLVGFLCEGDCLKHCRRSEVDSSVNLPLLERICVSLTKSSRLMSLPPSDKYIAVAGAGLSSLCLAFELGKKGHTVTVFHRAEPGSSVLPPTLPPGRADFLPDTAVDEALEQLAALRVKFEQTANFSPDWIGQVLEQAQAVYIGLDDANVRAAGLVSGKAANTLTLETDHPKIFAGGLSVLSENGEISFVRDAADGKRAAGSIVRLLQGVSPAAAREKDGVYPTRLYTDISNVRPTPPVPDVNPAEPAAQDAAAQEAMRCIQCECLECVKHCAYLAHYKGYPKRYAREIYNNLSVVHGLRRTNRQINSCALCGLCAVLCPQQANMGDFCATARREMVQSKRMPPSAHEFALEDMGHSNASDIAFFRHQPGTAKSVWAFFPGCQLPASLPGPTKELYAFLQKNLPHGLDEGIGLFFRCCGAPGKWSGREGLLSDCVRDLHHQWEEAGSPSLILACASCSAFFAAELPDIPIRSLWEVLADLPLPDNAKRLDSVLALHDPCAVRHAPLVRKKARQILASLGQKTEEPALSGDLTRCCGYGGLADAAAPQIGLEIAKNRTCDTEHDLIAYCIMCRDRLAAMGKGVLHLLDLLFPGEESKNAALRKAPGISERQLARLTFRQEMLHDLWNEKTSTSGPMDKISLRISDDLASKLECRRILHTDIKSVLLHAEEHGAQFFNPSTGRCLTSMRPRQVTFWVQYSKESDSIYTIHDAYCHRMIVPGTPGKGLPTAATLEGYAFKGGRL